jgi:Excalibur calcium-binding domain
MHKSVAILGVTLAAGVIASAAPADAATHRPAPRHYANCRALNAVYPHGVGRTGARDHVRSKSDRPVTNFTVDNRVYALNTSLDRDHDGIACEKH